MPAPLRMALYRSFRRDRCDERKLRWPTRDEPARFAISARNEVRYDVREATRGPAPARILLLGATGYGLYRLIRERGYECSVVSPSLSRAGSSISLERCARHWWVADLLADFKCLWAGVAGKRSACCRWPLPPRSSALDSDLTDSHAARSVWASRRDRAGRRSHLSSRALQA